MSSDWESYYRENRIPWEKGGPHPELVRVLSGGLSPFERRSVRGEGRHCAERILVPGCGYGHDVRALALALPDASVTGLDIAPSALAEARKRTAGLAGARLVEGDLFDPPEEWLGCFDVVVEHTCLSGLPPERRVEYAEVIRRLLRPGGILAAVFFIDPDMEPGEQGPPFGISRQELDRLLADGFKHLETRFPIATYPGRERREDWRVYRKR